LLLINGTAGNEGHSKTSKSVTMRFLTFTLLFVTLSLSTYATQHKKTVKLRIQSQNGNLDEATVYFDQAINPNYVYQEDAQEVLSGVAGVPVIYTLTTDNYRCSINGVGTLSNTEVVPVGVIVDVTGTYNLTGALLDNFDPTSIITLEDRNTGRFIDLRTNFYPVVLDSGAAPEGRFFIHASYPSSSSKTVAGCANNDAELQITSDPSVTWDSYELFDAFNNSVGVFNNVNAPVTFTGLAEGDYYLLSTYGAYSTTEEFHIDGNYILANVGASATQVSTLENISFSANAINANHFAWDFGDGTLIIGVAHPDLAYYEPGVYTVNLHASNDHGCTDNAQIEIIVSQSVSTAIKEETKNEIAIAAQNKTVTVTMNGVTNDDAQLQVYNLIGQSVYNASIVNEKTTASLNEQPSGYYLVSVKNSDKVKTKRIFIGN
jgi:PKD repeat protein